MTGAALSVDGQLVPLDGPHLSALDRGFLLGDGLFETIRVRRGRPVRLERHLARLRAGAAVLDLPVRWDDGALAEIARRTLAAAGVGPATDDRRTTTDDRRRRTEDGRPTNDDRRPTTEDGGRTTDDQITTGAVSEAVLRPALCRSSVAGRPSPVVRPPEAVVRLTVSRGVSQQRGLLPEPDPSPTLVVHAARFAGYPAALYERGMRATVSRIRRNERSPLANVKSINYLDNVLARREAAARGADEALLLNTAGMLAGASAANLFLVFGESLVTPTCSCGALPGTVRQALSDLLPNRVAERPVPPEDLRRCQEAFLTNALLGIMPLTAVDGRPVGSGRPGPVTLALDQMLLDAEQGAS